MTLATVLDAHVTAADQKARAGHKSTSRFYASGADACYRQRWYQATGKPKDPDCLPDGVAILRMEVGNWLHDQVQSCLTANGITAEVPWRIGDLGGRADGFGTVVPADLEDEIKAAPFVVEIKTMAGYGFKLRQKAGPERRHILQGMLSAHALGLNFSNVKGLWLVYVSRDSMAVLTYWIDYDDEWREAVSRELEIITSLRLRLRGTTPARLIPDDTGYPVEVADPMAKSAPWQCRFCGYRQTCAWEGA